MKRSGGLQRRQRRTALRLDIMAADFYFTPELHLKDGRVIRDTHAGCVHGEVEPSS